MPELPEVEVIRRDLETEIVGASIRSVQVRHTKNAMRVIRRHRTRRELEEPLTGATVTSVDRRGKYLIVRLDRDQALVIHLGMSGQLLRTAAKAGYENHTHVVFDIGPGDQLRYVDPRSFGELFVSTLGDGGEVPELRLLGLDPLEHQLSWPHFHRLLSERRMKLKSLLMDQRMIAGIGNIYSDEILFWAGLLPSRACDSLTEAEVRRLYRAMQEVLREAISHRGTSADDEQYRDLHGDS